MADEQPDERPGQRVEGGCFCGSVRYEMTLPTLFCAHCHCSMCRRPHGAAFVTWTAVPPEHFRVIEGASRLQTYASSEAGRRQFCGDCGTQLFCFHEHADGTPPDMIDVTLASLHGAIDRQPEMHVHFDSRASWVDVQDGLPRLGGPTGLEPLE